MIHRNVKVVAGRRRTLSEIATSLAVQAVISTRPGITSKQVDINCYNSTTMVQEPLPKGLLIRKVKEACKADDVSLMADCIAMASRPDSKATKQEMLEQGLQHSAKRSSTKVLSYVLEQGADISNLTGDNIIPGDTLEVPSLEMLNLLIEKGWNIDSRIDAPFLWSIVYDHALVEWCLARGASVDLPVHPPILEHAAAVGNIATFELLRAKGAPLGPRMFPIAVQSASECAPKRNQDRSAHNEATYSQQIDMVRHLLDVLKVDVNVESRWPGSFCSTPLCCIACHPQTDATEVTWLLLDHGGDPDLAGPLGSGVPSALEAASYWSNNFFLQAVEEWRAKRDNNASENA